MKILKTSLPYFLLAVVLALVAATFFTAKPVEAG
jgi:hypothetical protein